MLRATLKGLLGHKLRLIITALAVTLGVAFVSGTFVLTDTINHTFDKLFGEVMAGTDVVVRSKTLFTGGGGGPGSAGCGAADNLGGATLAVFEYRTAQRVLGRVGRVDSVGAIADKGVSRAELQARIARVLDPRYEALTGTRVADETSKDIKSNLG